MFWGIQGGGVSKGWRIQAALFLMGVLGHGSLKFDDHEQKSKLLYSYIISRLYYNPYSTPLYNPLCNTPLKEFAL